MKHCHSAVILWKNYLASPDVKASSIEYKIRTRMYYRYYFKEMTSIVAKVVIGDQTDASSD